MEDDKRSKEIIKELYEVTNQNNIDRSGSSFSFSKEELIDDYFKEMKKSKFWFIDSFKFKSKKFLRLYMPHLFLFLKRINKFHGNK